MKSRVYGIFAVAIILMVACQKESDQTTDATNADQSAIERTFGGRIDMDNLPNYANQNVPIYVSKDNTRGNPITDAGATLGRVLFYDTRLSSANTISCASCHKQEFAFGDGDAASTGVNGTTGRHSMRLINARFADELRFFWDERANTLEDQTTMPIQDHVEMGYSGQNGDEDINALIQKLEALDYYQELFTHVFGDATITEERMQTALAQFVRSIQSFDSRYDQGRAQVGNNGAPFPNFTAQENQGKGLFQAPAQFDNNGLRISGGFGCGVCHRAPEFDIAPNSRNNGVIANIDGTGQDLDVVRSPSLRDIVNGNGQVNGPLMHTGTFNSIEDVLDHYNDISRAGNNNLDPRLSNGPQGQNLAMTQAEKDAMVAFLMTLSGSDVYTNEKWSDPF